MRAGGNRGTIRKYAEEIWHISTEHFDPDRARTPPSAQGVPLEDVLVVGSTYSRGTLKRRLLSQGIKFAACEICRQGEVWKGRRMALILDHVNGVADDNRVENLRIVCPNCAATLDTHCGRQNRLAQRPVPCLRCSSEFLPRYPSHRYCSRACGIRHPSDARPRPERRKVPRPRYGQLVREVRALGYRATGRRYGVSDNAIRKWIRAYEKELSADDQRRGDRAA